MPSDRVVKLIAWCVGVAALVCWFAADARSTPPEPGPSALDACIEQCRSRR